MMQFIQMGINIEDLTIGDFYYDPNNDTGYAFKFANNMTVTSQIFVHKKRDVLTKVLISASDPKRI